MSSAAKSQSEVLTRQPLLVKVGSAFAFAASLDLLIFVPIAASIAVIGGVGTPASSRAGMILPFVLMSGMFAIGLWVNCLWMGWFSGEAMPIARRLAQIAIASVLSTALSASAAWFHVWPFVFICAIAFLFLGLVTCSVLCTISRWIHGAT